MTTDKKIHALTGEFFLLLAKYGKDTFISMSERLEYNDIDPAIKLISEKLKKSKKMNVVKKNSLQDNIEQMIEEKTPTSNSSEIKKIESILSNNLIFRTKKELETFIKNQTVVGVGLINFKTRKSIIDSFINIIRQVSPNKTALIYENLTSAERSKTIDNDDRSLENWSRIILNEKDKNKK